MMNKIWVAIALILGAGLGGGGYYLYNRNQAPTPVQNPTGSSQTSTPTQTSNQAPGTQTTQQYPVKVFFSKDPDSLNDFTKTFPVDRDAGSAGVATYVIGQLIVGPTTSETSQGLFTAVKLTGDSNCSGNNFTITISSGAATLKFCRQFVSAGTGDDARAQSEINDSLKQFSTIQKVVVLNRDDHCLFDQSGMDRCKQ